MEGEIHLKRRILFLLMLCLLAAMCGCRVPSAGESSSAAVTTEAPQPARTDTRLELDGTEAGTLYELSGVSYVQLQALCAVWPLTLSEEDGSLRVELEGTVLTLRDGFDEVQAADGGRISLPAAVRRCSDGWYLPADALERLWGRTLVGGGTEALYCLRVEEGPAIRWNGAEQGTALSCNGIPVLTAAQLADLSGCGVESGADPDGAPILTLRTPDRAVSFRPGGLRTAPGGIDAALPIPAWQAGESWYLPAAAAVEALGCTVTEADPQTLSVWQAEAGQPCWVCGRCLGPAQLFGDSACVELSALAEAVGGRLSSHGGVLTLRAMSHSLRLYPGEPRLEADGDARTLPTPILPHGDGWLVPLAPVAEALGLPEQADEAGTVYSRIRPCDTLLWLDGVQTPSYTLPEGGLYVRIADVLAALGGSLVPMENEASLLVWGKEIDLRGGAAECSAAGETVALSGPVLAAGTDWYAPAPELLPAIGLTELIDPELDQRYYTHIAKHDEIPTGYRVPILMYHAVSDSLWGIPELFVSPSMLEAQIQAMLAEGYTPISFEDLDHVDEIPKPVILTFDDGYDNNYTELFPLLQKYNVKATVFVIVEKIGKRYYLTEEQIKEMSASGLVSIQSHTMSHGDLDLMYESQLRYEHYDSMISLTRLTGRQPFVMCYPTGKNSAYSRYYTAEYYEYGLNMGGNCYVTGDAPYRIYRSYISRETGVEQFLQKLAS